jgi:glyoxylase-like metal-dependent hydrolase (beta-lactamase superfamily II)
LSRHGIEAELASEMVGKRGAYKDLATTIPGAMTEIRDGGHIRFGNRDWEIFVTPGHSFEHASFLDRQSGIWISGDHLLPKISPVIAVDEMLPNADPLGDYLSSFERFADFAADMLVLPSHGMPYCGVHDRIDELRQHHAERLDATARFLHSQKTSFELSLDMFPHVEGADSIGFAFGETIAHINYLVARGIVEKTEQADGLLLFRTKTSSGQGGLPAGGIR